MEADRWQFTSCEVPLIPGGIRFAGEENEKAIQLEARGRIKRAERIGGGSGLKRINF